MWQMCFHEPLGQGWAILLPGISLACDREALRALSSISVHGCWPHVVHMYNI